MTKDQTLRLGYAMARQHQSNLGIGLYDSPERAYGTDFTGYQIRVQEAGPIGRRTFGVVRAATVLRASKRCNSDTNVSCVMFPAAETTMLPPVYIERW